MFRCMIALAILVSGSTSLGQSTAAPVSKAPAVDQSATREFEVASVRRAPANRQGLTDIGPPNTNRFTARNVSLRILVAIAYGVNSNRIESRLPWLDTTVYDVTAKAEDGTLLSSEQLQPMLQRLLERRFHLKCHSEIREVPGYALVVAKGGPKLQPSSAGGAMPYIVRGGLRGAGISMKSLAGMLESPAGHPVMDKTDLQGTFDINLSFAPDDAPDSGLPSFFTAVQEQLGLKLEPRKVPINVLVIDRANEQPEEN